MGLFKIFLIMFVIIGILSLLASPWLRSTTIFYVAVLEVILIFLSFIEFKYKKKRCK